MATKMGGREQKGNAVARIRRPPPRPLRGVDAEEEARHRGAEHGAVGTDELVVPFHVPLRTLQDAEALVLVRLPGGEARLLAHDPLPLHLVVARQLIVAEPVASYVPRIAS